VKIEAVGPILHPDPPLVAGVPLELGDTRFELVRCPECTFQFKDPVIDAEQLLACYSAADSDKWGESPDPLQRRFDTIRAVVEKHTPPGKVLDVGCFNGAMLDYFGDRWQRFGVEPSLAAAELARERGINVLCDTLERLPPEAGPFDAILAIDVLEHLVEPLPFFRQISERLRPGGVFVAFTGNTNSLAWRLQRSMYWYCSLPEHVSFYNRKAIAAAGGQVGLELIECSFHSHKRHAFSNKLSDLTKSTAYVVGRAAGGFGLKRLRHLFVERRGPSLQAARDHLLCVLQKR
jgi:SAM-dependent methyltransferase